MTVQAGLVARIKDLLAEHNRTPNWLAGELGMYQSTLSRQLGNESVDVDVVVGVARTFGVSVEWLLTGERAERTLPRPESGQKATLEPIGDEERVRLMGMLAGVTQALADGLEQKPGPPQQASPGKPTDEEAEEMILSESGGADERPGVDPTGTDD